MGNINAAKLWTFSCKSKTSGISALAGDVLICADSDTLYGIGIYNGSVQWQYGLSGGGIVRMSHEANSLFFIGNPVDFGGDAIKDVGGSGGGSSGVSGFSSGNASGQAVKGLVVLDTGTGKIRQEWKDVAKKHTALMDPLVDDGMLILRDNAGNMYAYEIETRTLKWTLKDLSTLLSLPSNLTPGPAALGDRAAFFTIGGTFAAVNVRSGQVRWRFSQAGDKFIQVNAPLVGSALAIAAGSANLYALDVKSGKLLWKFSAGGNNASWLAPAVSWEQDVVFAATDQGTVYAINAVTGKELWSSAADALKKSTNFTGNPGTLLAPVVNKDVVQIANTGKLVSENHAFLPTSSGAVFLLCAEKDALRADAQYKVTSSLVSAETPGIVNGLLIGNGSYFFDDGKNTVFAYGYGTQKAAYFSGSGKGSPAYIEVPYEPEYAFAAGNFTIEGWVRTTQGGEILSQYPDNSGNGFRLSLGTKTGQSGITNNGEGRIQFSVTGSTGIYAVQTHPSRIADGTWHHVAVVYDGKNASIFLDGGLQKLSLPKTPPAGGNLPVNSKNPLIIGAAGTSAAGYSNYYGGLLTELRLWNQSLTVSQIEDRMAMRLTGRETGLVGYWRLDKDFSNVSSVSSSNQTRKALDPAPRGVSSPTNFTTTNLVLSDDLFPYLVNTDKEEWPYKSTWYLHGENSVLGPPVSTGEVLCFSTGKNLYGACLIHGKRKWAIDSSSTFSMPVALDGKIFVVEGEMAKAFDGETGRQLWQSPMETPVAGGSQQISLVPAYLQVAATSGGKKIFGIDMSSGAQMWSYDLPNGLQGEVRVDGNLLYLVLGKELLALQLAKDGKSVAPLATFKLNSTKLNSTTSKPVLSVDNGAVFFYDGSNLYSLDGSTLKEKGSPGWSKPDLKGKTVTGLSANANSNRVVVTTEGGELIAYNYSNGGLEYTKGGFSGKVFTPFIHEAEVFCAISEPKSAIIGFDLRTGARRAHFSPGFTIQTAPYFAKGTAFFGIGDGDNITGLGSVVFGTTYALEMADGDKPVVIDAGNMVFDNPKNYFSLETWINTSTGGEIFSLPPGKERKTGVILNVSGDGTVTVDAFPNYKEGWIRAISKSSSAADGRWRHLAAVYKNGTDGKNVLLVYLDGNLMKGTTNTSLITPPILYTEDRKVTIGGTDKQNAYKCLIHDVRVWNNFLHDAQIRDRMQVKLRGNEPELLAAWDFDAKGVYDRSKNNLNSVQAQDYDYWLVDLGFSKPRYPYLIANSKAEPGILDKSDPEKPVSYNRYTINIQARQADGSPIQTALKVWASYSATVTNGNGKSGTLNPPDGEPFVLSTGADGNVTITLQTEDGKQSPELEIWAGIFDFEDERFHVSPVVESQDRITIQPKLTAQSKMLQDYKWDTGDKIKSSNVKGDIGGDSYQTDADTSTYQVILTATTALDYPAVNEDIEIWSTDNLNIRVSGKEYSINKENSAKFKTGPDGKLTISLEDVSDIKTPTLRVRAGFMDRSQRFDVNPADDAQKTLASVTEAQLAGEQPTSPDSPPVALLNKQQAPEAKKAIRQVMSSANAAPTPSANAAGASDGQGAAISGVRLSDQITPALSASHIGVQRGITPGFMENEAWSFDLKRTQFTPLKYADTVKDMDKWVPDFTQVGNKAGDFWGGLWDGIRDTADEVGEGVENASKVIVRTTTRIIEETGEVVNRIEMAVVDAANKAITWVINTVDDAFDAVKNFFKELATDIGQVIKFLRSAFNWGNIIKVQKIIAGVLTYNLKNLEAGIGQLDKLIDEKIGAFAQEIKTSISSFFDKLGAKEILPAGSENSLAGTKGPQSGVASSATSAGNGAKGNFVLNKVRQNGDDPPATQNVTQGAQDSQPASDTGIEGAIDKLYGEIKTVFSRPGGLASLTLPELLDLFKDFLVTLVELAEEAAKGFVDLISAGLQEMVGFLSDELDIPFVSALFEWITGGEKLSFVNLAALILAIPTNIVINVAAEFDASITYMTKLTDGDVKAMLSAFQQNALFPGNEAGAADQPGTAQSQANPDSLLKISNVLYVVSTITYGIVAAFRNGMQGGINAVAPSVNTGTVLKDKLLSRLSAITYLFALSRSVFKVIVKHEVERIVYPSGSSFYIPWKNAKGYSEIVSPLVYTGFFFYQTYKAIKGNQVESYGKLWKINTDIASTILGVGLMVHYIHSIATIVKDPRLESADQNEGWLDLVTSLPTAVSFLNYSPLVKSSSGTTTVVLVFLDVAVYSLVETVMHETIGFGQSKFYTANRAVSA